MGAVSPGLLASLLERSPQIDWSNPITRGLVFASFGGGPELISGVFPVPMGSARLGSNEHGRTFESLSNTTDGWYWPLPPSHPIYSISTEDSSYILMRRDSGTTASNVFGIPYRSGSWSTPFYAWTLATSSTNSTSGAYSFAASSSTRRTSTAAGFYTNGEIQGYGVTRSGARARYYAGGVQVGADVGITAGSPDFVNRRPPVLFNRSSNSIAEGTTGEAGVVLVWNRELSAAEWKSINDNPSQILRRRSTTTLFATPASVALPINLTGAAVAQLSASGMLSTAIRLTGAAQMRATAAGTLSTSIRLAGAAGAQVSAAGTLTTAVRLTGAATMQVSAAGSLAGAGAALAGTAYAQVSAAGALSTSIALSGVASARMSASGALAGAAAVLAGGTALQVSAAGALSTAIVLTGTAGVRMSAAGALSAARAPIDISTISPARIVIFEGSGSRIVTFEGTGSRVVPFGGSGHRVTLFEGSGSRVTPFESSGSRIVRFE